MKVIVATLLLAVVALFARAEAGVIAYHQPAAVVPAAVVPAATLYAAPAPLVRTPSLDSAVVHSERVGGNFAYSTVEGHAYTALGPVVHHAPAVALSYRAAPIVAPLPAATVVHAAIPATTVVRAAAPAPVVFYAH